MARITRRYCLALMVAILLCLAREEAQSPGPAAGVSVDIVIDRVIDGENRLVKKLSDYTPIVETYVQLLKGDDELGAVPNGDRYFIGKLAVKDAVSQHSFLPRPGFASPLKNAFTQVYSIQYVPDGFAQMILVDGRDFNRNSYDFEFVRREFIGEVRCLVFDVQPKPSMRKAHFEGRIWVEDQDYNIVRFNGTYDESSSANMYFHFDSWREQMGPGLWLPAYVYSEESDMSYAMGLRRLRFKGQTRIWGYDAVGTRKQTELTAVMVEADKINDQSDARETFSPVLSLRAWERQAEDNVLQRLQKAGLLAPDGNVEKVLETVVTNLEVTNKLQIEPETRVRVVLTSPLESFTIGHTIVLSRGLIDVLPDEASLAMVLAHELAHIALGHRLDTKYAFNDRMLFDDTDTFRRIRVKRDKNEESAADGKAIEFMRVSPYKDKLASAGLFLRTLNNRSKQLPNLLAPHLGNPMAEGGKVKRMADLMKTAPNLEMTKVEQISALPLGGRLRVDPWSNRLELVKTQPVALLSAREKLPFEVTPIFINLTRQKDAGVALSNNK